MINYYFNIGLTYMVVGFAVALVYYFFIDRNILGKFWGALLVGLAGSYIGGLLDYLLRDVIRALVNFNNSVNLFPPLIAAFVIMAIYARVSPRE